MKTTVSPKNNERANVLLVVIGVTLVAGITLASFLKLVAGQNTSVARSQAWNASIPVVEAGIEEAMTHLNDNCTYTDISHPNTNSWAIDGWTTTDVGVKKKTYLPGNSYYEVEIITAFPYSSFQPAIVSEGHMASPFSAQIVAPNPFLAQIGTTVTPTTRMLSTNVARKVRITAGQRGLFAKGLVAKYNIDLNGNNIATDSFDSADPAYSTGGQYDVSKHKSHGDVATDSGLINSLSVGNANIAGSVSTGHGGSVSIGANGTVGDLAWVSSHNGIQPGHSTDDMNVYFPDVKPPFTGGYSSPEGPLTMTNLDRTTGTTTNTVNSYPVGQSPVITNTVTVTTASFPAAGTYLGTPSMNTARTTTTTFPAADTYTGTVVTNTDNITSVTFPAAGTYIGTPRTNTESTTTSTYPGSGTYAGSVFTNTAATNSSTYPDSGSYLGTVATNTAPTNSMTYPSSGTYLGSVTTNIIATNSSTLPGGGFSGTVTTNFTTVTTASYPAPGSFVPPVATNTSATTSQSYPASGTYTGVVVTNTLTSSSPTPPSPGSYVGSITTNSAPTTTSTYPSSGTYVGGVTTNTQSMTSTTSPSSGSYVGTVTTNTALVTTATSPAFGTYVGSVTTNASVTTTVSYPSDGTYLGTITTNCGTTVVSAKGFPAAGTYCGTPWQTGNSQNNNSAWNWYALSGYTYNKINSYTYTKIDHYTYTGITGYAYNRITGYSYNSVVSYSYNLITGYTYAQPSTYSYIAGTNYAYLLITGYNYNTVSGYTYDLITGYSYQGVSSFTFDAITGWTWAKIINYTYYTYSSTVGTSVETYDWVLRDGNYSMSSFSGKVLVTGHATLYVTDSINFTGHDQITINPGASLKLYSAARVATLGGNGVWNNGGNATNFYYYGLPSNEKIAISGNGQITGVIYAPEADLTLNGGGHDSTDFIGATVTGTATLNGHFKFHYDEDLAKHGPAQSFAIDSWNEIPLTARY